MAADLAMEMKRAAKQLAADGKNLDSCRATLICAYLQNRSGKAAAALETLHLTRQLARRCDLVEAGIWANWGASAVCAQSGEYARSADYLFEVQQVLYRNNEWVMANFIDLVRQLLLEQAASRTRNNLGCLSSTPDTTSLLIDQMLCWGKPPPEIAADLYRAVLLPDGAAKPGDRSEARGRRSLWQNLRRFLRGELRLQFTEVSRPALHYPTMREEPPLSDVSRSTAQEMMAKAAPPPQTPPPSHATGEQPASPPDLIPPADAPQPTVAGSSPVAVEPLPTPATLAEAGLPALPAPRLNVYFLASFRVELGNVMIDEWPSARSRAVFAYLLAHHAHPVQRDVLMETFWPETALDSARNNLNVAVYTLRQMLKNLLDIPVILSHESAYQVNPNLPLWLDVEAFEQSVRYAHRLETSGALDAAVGEYKLALDLYQGDFLADTPYEGWATLERERLRVLFLETLDHLSILYFNQGLYGDCVRLCQRILSHDACREDAHCRLMRCYARQGQAHLALRQYQACIEALRDELDVPPSPVTVQLYEQIKRQEMV